MWAHGKPWNTLADRHEQSKDSMQGPTDSASGGPIFSQKASNEQHAKKEFGGKQERQEIEFIFKEKQGWGYSSVVKHLTSMFKAPGWISNTARKTKYKPKRKNK